MSTKQDIFVKHCKYGHIKNIKRLSLKKCNLDEGFRWACVNGHYEVVKYLIELYKRNSIYYITYKKINDTEIGFRWACEKGHYDIVKYLVELYKNDINYNIINIHAENDYGFTWACNAGHYKVVKYLVELYKTENQNYGKINIHSTKESGFGYAYRNGHYMIVKYLMTICKKHKYKPFNCYLIIFKKFNKYKL